MEGPHQSTSVSYGFSFSNGLWIGGNPTYGQYLNGKIDDARIYSSALSAFQMLELYLLSP